MKTNTIMNILTKATEYRLGENRGSIITVHENGKLDSKRTLAKTGIATFGTALAVAVYYGTAINEEARREKIAEYNRQSISKFETETTLEQDIEYKTKRRKAKVIDTCGKLATAASQAIIPSAISIGSVALMVAMDKKKG